MQCLIGLSVLFFLIPDLSHKNKVSELAEQIATQMVRILNGVRSIWLFDFISSGPFLQKVILTITKVMERVNKFLFFFKIMSLKNHDKITDYLL